MEKIFKNPCHLEAGTRARWVSEGDIEEAEQLATMLSATLYSLAETIEKNHRALLDTGMSSFLDIAELRLIAKALHTKPHKEGAKSGAQLFAKVLVPGKPSKSKFTSRWIAATATMNDVTLTEGKVDEFVDWLNLLIDKNNKAFDHLLINGPYDPSDEPEFSFSPAIPKRKVTTSQVAYALRNKGKLLEG
ncbi:MAG: hypothetical protein KGL40_07065 [Rhodocyclaceae bacterium]|nr:hypothetical protein [Rhodocyclaceae bacterium]